MGEVRIGGEEVFELKRFMKRTSDKQEYMRALIVLMRTKKPYRQITKELNVALSTTYTAVRRYKKNGIDGLRSKKRGGKKSRIEKEEREVMVELSLRNPQLFGFVKNNWSLRALSKFLIQKLDVCV